jgi:D-xylose transport system substrate-binding protein
LEKKETPVTDKSVNNGRVDVPFIYLEPIPVDKENVDATVIKDGYQKREDVYKKP